MSTIIPISEGYVQFQGYKTEHYLKVLNDYLTQIEGLVKT
jgi:hypothetical protein